MLLSINSQDGMLFGEANKGMASDRFHDQMFMGVPRTTIQCSIHTCLLKACTDQRGLAGGK